MQRIDQFNANKKYIRLSTNVLQSIINSENLSKKASSVWLAIYSISFHKKDLVAPVSHRELSSITGISCRSIGRAIAELKGSNYIIQHLSDPNYPTINIYECSIPDCNSDQKEIGETPIFEEKENPEIKNIGNPFKKMAESQSNPIEKERSDYPVDNFDDANFVLDNKEKTEGESVVDISQEVVPAQAKKDHLLYNNNINNINYNLQCTDCDFSKIEKLEKKKAELESRTPIYENEFKRCEASWFSNPVSSTYESKKCALNALDCLKIEILGVSRQIEERQRLVGSPAVVVDADEFTTASMRRLMRAMKQESDALPVKVHLELNPQHPVIVGLEMLRVTDAPLAAKVVEQIFDSARLTAGLLEDPQTLLRRMNELLERVVAPKQLS